jgi:TP901 family phage tail tape measure protein
MLTFILVGDIMADVIKGNLVINTKMSVEDAKRQLDDLQKQLNKLSIPENLSEKLSSNFISLGKELDTLQKKLNTSFKTKGDISSFSKTAQNIQNLYNNLANTIGKVRDLGSKAFANIDMPEVNIAKEKVKALEEQINKVTASFFNIGEIRTKLDSVSGATDKLKEKVQQFYQAIESGDISNIEDALKVLETAQNRYQSRYNVDQSKSTLKPGEYAYVEVYNKAKAEVDSYKQSIQALEAALASARAEQENKYNKAIEQGARNLKNAQSSVKDYGAAMQESNEDVKDTVDNMLRMDEQIDSVARRIANFTSLTGTIEILRRTMRDAFNDVKELDAAMNSIAIVTDFTNQQLWNQVDAYAKLAQEMGVDLVGVYDVQKLYYQQGRDMTDVAELTEKTLQFARIAEMDYADATDAMTVAINAFKLEATDASRVVDVYSNLAAKAAVDQSELANAMSKVASMASSVGMSLETTSAFLTQIIETTREAPETAGTALKTVLARFGEVKKLISTGENAGTTDEGESVDVNKIDTALKSVGIRLTDTQGQMRALDDVLLDLAKKWNSLDSMTQRYLATMAAGSRQQSRFIALMADSERLTKLLGEAYNSAGAGEKQYEKTLESLESKINNLETAWTQFTTSILNSEIIKGGVDLLTKLLNGVNALTDAFGPLSGTIKAAAVGFGLWKVNTALLPKVTSSIKNILREIRGAETGAETGATAKDIALETKKGTQLGTIFAKAYAAAKSSIENAHQKEQEAKDILNAQVLGTEKAKAEMTSKKMYELAATTQGIEDAKLQATAEGLIYGEWKAKFQEAMEAFESLSSVKRITAAFAYGKATGESWGAGFSSALAAFKTTDLFTKILSPFGPVVIAAMTSAVVASIPAILSNADSIISNYKIKKNNQAKAENEELINQYEAEIASLENQENLTVGDKKRLQYLKEQTEELKKQNDSLNKQNFGEEKKKRGEKEYTVYEKVEYTPAGGNERSSHAGETKTKTVSKQLEGEDAALDYASQKIDEYQEKLDNLGKGDSRYEGYKGTIEYYKNIAQDIFDFYSDSFEEITDTSDYEKLFKAADILGKDTSVLELFDSDTYDKIKELNEQGALSAENLADLAKKSDVLRIYLDTTGKTVEDFVKDLKSLEATNPFSTDKITGYKNAAEEIKNIKTSVSAITDAVSNLYKDGYVDIEKLSTIVNDDAFNKLPSFENFFDILSKAGKEDIPQVTSAMEILLQEYMSSETVLTSLNETTAGLYENMLKNMGVTNASEVIENKLQQRRAETAAQTLTLAEINNLLSGSNNNLSSTLANLANQYNTTTQYIAAYLIKMKIASGAKVSTSASRAELEKLVKSLGIASDALSAYYNIIAIADSQQRKATLIRTGAMAGTEAEARQYMLNANANYESAKKVLAKKADEILNTTSNITIDTSNFNTTSSKSSSPSNTEKEIQKLSELYNAKKKLAAIDEKINDLEEKDNILQDYDSMLANERQLIAAQKEKQDVLRELINQNEVLRKQKLAEATSAWKNFYNVDETTHELELTKTYYEAIKKGSKTAAKYSADTLNNFKKWAEEYEDIVEFSREQENSINSINSKLLETWYNYRSDYVDLVNQLAELYEQAQQKIIDDQKDAYDKLKEQDDNYLDELRKNIDARRKARDRENDVEEIVKKQKRLAMLMRDSSGRNAGEIADLQKEIQNAQQDVIDEDIDRVIDSMEEANDKQQENWDNVIDKLQEQLDQDKENGKFIRLAEQKFEEGPEAVMKQFEIFFRTGNTPYSQAEIDQKLKEVLDKLDNAFEYYNGNNPAENPGGTGNKNYTPIKYLDPNGNVQQGYISSEGKTYKDRGLTERVDEGSIVPDAAGKHAWKLVGDKGVDVTNQLTDAQKRMLGIGTGGQGTSSSNINTNTTTSRAKVANTGGKGVNLRSGPGQNYRKVGAYSDGTTVTVLDESNSAWWKVKVGNATGYMASQYLKKYLNGGLVDFTGPAWVDGSKSAPEAFLNAQDTRNFAQLKDILASLLRADRFKANEVTTARGGDCTIYVTVDQIASDYDVDEAVARIKQEIMSGSAYRNINLVNRHR